MKIKYHILWVEDEPSWYETTLQLFKETLADDGFELISERKDNIQQIRELIAQDGLKKFDMLIIDFTLKDSEKGDYIIKLISENDIYTDVLFYSSAPDKVKESMFKNGLEGVYTADRKDIEVKFNAVFKTTIKKIQEINAMRGLIMGETSELDVEIEDLVMLLVERYNKSDEDLRQIINEKVFLKLESNVKNFWTNYDTFKNYFPKIDAVKKWEILRDLLKPLKSTNSDIKTFLENNKTYQDQVITIRNQFAHVKPVDKNGVLVLEGKEKIVFTDEICVQIRKDLIAHKQYLEELKAIILKES